VPRCSPRPKGQVRRGRPALRELLDPANKPDDEKDDKNSSENAAADVHGNLLLILFDAHSIMNRMNCRGATVQSDASFRTGSIVGVLWPASHCFFVAVARLLLGGTAKPSAGEGNA